jgi:hypothetical protein
LKDFLVSLRQARLKGIQLGTFEKGPCELRLLVFQCQFLVDEVVSDEVTKTLVTNLTPDRFGAFITPLIAMGYALDFASADATADLDYFDNFLSSGCKAYGVSGKVYNVQSSSSCCFSMAT